MEPPRDELDRWARQKREGYQRVALVAGLAFGLGIISFLLSPLAQWVFIVAALAYAITGVWSLRPGACVACGTRTLLSVPATLPAPEKKWWDLRHRSRKDGVFICPDDVAGYLRMRVALEMHDEDERR